MLCLRPAIAGPPYQTDDPEPVAFRHYEIYLAAEYQHDADEVSGSLPLFEVNYGAASNVQVSIGVPLAYQQASSTPAAYGRGGVALGLKYRFVQETDRRPQISVYPQIVFPGAGSLGGGKPQTFLPIWLQKSCGPWTAFGGGGRWFNPGPGNEDYWFSGLAVERELSHGATLGAEIYHSTPQVLGATSRTGVGIGFTAPMGATHGVLFSIGRGVAGDNVLTGYLAYEILLGPR